MSYCKAVTDLRSLLVPVVYLEKRIFDMRSMVFCNLYQQKQIQVEYCRITVKHFYMFKTNNTYIQCVSVDI